MENQPKATMTEVEAHDHMMSRALISRFEISLVEGDEKLTKLYREVLKLRLQQEEKGIKSMISAMQEAEEKARKEQAEAGTQFVQNAENF